jgi:predicted MFS family arabinose efflux permease
LVVLAGVLGNLFASYLSNLFVNALQIRSGSAVLYRAILVAAISLSYLELLFLVLIKGIDLPEMATNQLQLKSEWNLSKAFFTFKGLLVQPIVLKLALIQGVFGFGVAIISPYINLFFHEEFSVSDQTLGIIFALKALFTGLFSLMVPMSMRIIKDRIKAVSISQLLGGIFALVLGLAPILPVAIFGFLLGSVFLNTPIPLLNAFSMEQVSENQRATLGSIREISWQLGWVAGPYSAGMLLDKYGFIPVFLTAFIAFGMSALLLPKFFRRLEQNNLVRGQANA